MVAQAISRLDVTVAPGLYQIERRLGDAHETEIVAVRPGYDYVDTAVDLPLLAVAPVAAASRADGTYRAAAEIDPTPKLHAATKEINAAAALFSAREPLAKIKLFSGSDGNAAAVRDIWASGADVVHFATHALADLRQPVASLLVLPATDANGKPTYLTAGQVQSWRGDTELVFLSACESAIGPPQYAAGMPGLQRAFLRAGARGVIATLAPIEDVMAQQFAEEFYGRYTRGMPAAQALSETQRAWLTPAPGIDAADQLRRRRLSVRSFDAEHLLVGAELTDGDAVAEVARRMLADSRVTYLHVHNAAPGCFAVRVERT